MAQNALTVPPPHPFIQPRYPSRQSSSEAPILSGGQSLALAGIAHDARNLVTALKLCSELVAEPGVLTAPHAHFANEIGSIAAASNHLVKRLSAIARTATLAQGCSPIEAPVTDVAAAVHELSGLLSAVAGPTVEVQIACLPCAGIPRLGEESLTRILLNLVRNAADAMPAGGRIRITAQRGGGRNFFWTLPSGADDTGMDIWEQPAESTEPQTVVLSVEDDGPGIPAELLERIFESGFSTRRAGRPWPDSPHHGLGLSIVRQLVEEAGGRVRAVEPPSHGARIEIEFPLTNVTPCLPLEHGSGDQNGRR